MNTFKIIILTGLVVLLMTTQTGCLLAAAAAGTGAGVAYVRGDTETSVQGDTKAVTEATEAVLKEMDLTIISSAATGLDGKVVARNASDNKIVVVVKHQSENVSQVSIRMGNFGNSAVQAEILQKIKDKLS